MRIASSNLIVIALCVVTVSVVLSVFSFRNSEVKARERGSKVQDMTNEGRSIAVVELFTSEGCSSCPPADANLKRIDSLGKENVYTLSFHVDYWNRLGWKDPFSSSDYTKRQYQYANANGSDQVYTPQMVVNGKTAFVGSKQSASDQAIKDATSELADHVIRVKAQTSNDSKSTNLQFEIQATNDHAEMPSELVLNVAVVSKSETVSVANGENGGRTLSHVSVVRSFDVHELSQNSGTVKVSLPDMQRDRLRVVVYTQNKNTLAITGATALDL